MTPQEVAEQVCGMYSDMTITPYATVHGIEWTCEITTTDGMSGVCVEFQKSIEDAVTKAYEEFRQTVGPHVLQKEDVK